MLNYLTVLLVYTKTIIHLSVGVVAWMLGDLAGKREESYEACYYSLCLEILRFSDSSV